MLRVPSTGAAAQPLEHKRLLFQPNSSKALPTSSFPHNLPAGSDYRENSRQHPRPEFFP